MKNRFVELPTESGSRIALRIDAIASVEFYGNDPYCLIRVEGSQIAYRITLPFDVIMDRIAKASAD